MRKNRAKMGCLRKQLGKFFGRNSEPQKTIRTRTKKIHRENTKSNPISKETKFSQKGNFNWHAKCNRRIFA